MNKDIRTIADHYGYESQSRQLIEEMAELTQALNKLWRATHGHLNVFYEDCSENDVAETCRLDVIEEIGDVRVCLEQILYFLDVEPEEIRNDMDVKISRQLERIEHEKASKE